MYCKGLCVPRAASRRCDFATLTQVQPQRACSSPHTSFALVWSVYSLLNITSLFHKNVFRSTGTIRVVRMLARSPFDPSQRLLKSQPDSAAAASSVKSAAR